MQKKHMQNSKKIEIEYLIQQELFKVKEEESCLLRSFFEHQKELPPWQRSASALISCPCSRCNPIML